MKAVIVAGGDVNVPFLARFLKAQKKPIYLVGVDGGCQPICRLGRLPDLGIGDFDTLDSEILDYMVDAKVELIRLKPEKDDTDMEAALSKLQEMGFDDVDILGGIGTRLDHSLVNILLLFRFCPFMELHLFDERNVIYVSEEEEVFSTQKRDKGLDLEYTYLSIIPFEEVTVKETFGLKYPLKDAVLPMFSSYAISNEILEDICRIVFSKGKRLVVQSKD